MGIIGLGVKPLMLGAAAGAGLYGAGKIGMELGETKQNFLNLLGGNYMGNPLLGGTALSEALLTVGGHGMLGYGLGSNLLSMGMPGLMVNPFGMAGGLGNLIGLMAGLKQMFD